MGWIDADGFSHYRGQPIPKFGGRTAVALVKEGCADLVQKYLNQVRMGGYA